MSVINEGIKMKSVHIYISSQLKVLKKTMYFPEVQSELIQANYAPLIT